MTIAARAPVRAVFFFVPRELPVAKPSGTPRARSLRQMQTARAHTPVLRLVNGERAFRAPPLPRAHTAARRVMSENRAASGIDARDARWVIAASTASSLEGGLAAILPPDRRRRLVSMAVHLGLREFDANLVIAIVQDAARAGLPALGRTTEERLAFVRARSASEGVRAPEYARLLAIATGLAAFLCGLLMLWVRSS